MHLHNDLLRIGNVLERSIYTNAIKGAVSEVETFGIPKMPIDPITLPECTLSRTQELVTVVKAYSAALRANNVAQSCDVKA